MLNFMDIDSLSRRRFIITKTRNGRKPAWLLHRAPRLWSSERGCGQIQHGMRLRVAAVWNHAGVASTFKTHAIFNLPWFWCAKQSEYCYLYVQRILHNVRTVLCIVIVCCPWSLLLTWNNFDPSWISNYIHYKMWYEITYPFWDYFLI